MCYRKKEERETEFDRERKYVRGQVQTRRCACRHRRSGGGSLCGARRRCCRRGRSSRLCCCRTCANATSTLFRTQTLSTTHHKVFDDISKPTNSRLSPKSHSAAVSELFLTTAAFVRKRVTLDCSHHHSSIELNVPLVSVTYESTELAYLLSQSTLANHNNHNYDNKHNKHIHNNNTHRVKY